METADLGERIRAIRQHRGYTQQHLASALDVSAQAVSKWERGENAPECVVQRSGLPIKYMGDAFLAAFIAGNHRQNAVKAALAAHSMSPDSLSIGISTGQFYIGPIGHPDFAHLDVIGDFVNLAARVQAWAGQHVRSRIAATAETMSGCSVDVRRGEAQEVEVKGKARLAVVHEVLADGS